MAPAEIWCHGSRCCAVVFCLPSNYRVDWTKLHIAPAVISFCGVGLTWYKWRMFVSCFVLNLYVFTAEFLNCSSLSCFSFLTLSLYSSTSLASLMQSERSSGSNLEKKKEKVNSKHQGTPTYFLQPSRIEYWESFKPLPPLFFSFLCKNGNNLSQAQLAHRLRQNVKCFMTQISIIFYSYVTAEVAFVVYKFNKKERAHFTFLVWWLELTKQWKLLICMNGQ